MNYPYFIPTSRDGLEGVIVNKYGSVALVMGAEVKYLSRADAEALINALQTVLQDEEKKR